MHRKCVKIRHKGRIETINLEYERNDEPDTDEESTSASEDESSDSDEENEDELVLTLCDTYQKPHNPKMTKTRVAVEPSQRRTMG